MCLRGDDALTYKTDDDVLLRLVIAARPPDTARPTSLLNIQDTRAPSDLEGAISMLLLSSLASRSYA